MPRRRLTSGGWVRSGGGPGRDGDGPGSPKGDGCSVSGPCLHAVWEFGLWFCKESPQGKLCKVYSESLCAVITAACKSTGVSA